VREVRTTLRINATPVDEHEREVRMTLMNMGVRCVRH